MKNYKELLRVQTKKLNDVNMELTKVTGNIQKVTDWIQEKYGVSLGPGRLDNFDRWKEIIESIACPQRRK